MNRWRQKLIVAGSLAVGVSLAATGIAAAAPASSSSARAVLKPGQELTAGQSLSAGSYKLTMQPDGNLVLTHGGTALWASDTWKDRGARAVLQHDGNFVIYQGGRAVWNSDTEHTGVVKAQLWSNGDFVLLNSHNSRIWESGTSNGRDELTQSRVYAIAFSKLNSYPYSWGAGHDGRPGPTYGVCEPPSVGTAGCQGLHLYGFDCSGFTRWIYYLATGRDVLGGGNTDDQIRHLHRIRRADLAPGDLIFFGDSFPGTKHVGIYVGDDRMINAYETGTRIEINSIYASGNIWGYYHY
jgi:cell wall-associated NlpC family hydrolase